MQLLVEKLQRELTTEVLPLDTFYLAEDYHQKYCLQRNQKVMQMFNGVYPNFADFVNSTAAARLNGFSAGYGSLELLAREKDTYGLGSCVPTGIAAIDQAFSDEPVR